MTMQMPYNAEEDTDLSYYWFSKTSGTILAHNEDHLVEAASTIKILVMAKLLHDAEIGAIDLDSSVEVTKSDVGALGSGLLQYFSLPQSFKLYNLLLLMMNISDNTATNVLIKILGQENINQFAVDQGFTHTKLLMPKLDFDKNMSFGDTTIGQTTAYEMSMFVGKLMHGGILAKPGTDKIMHILRQSSTSRIARRLPFGVNKPTDVHRLGSKTGTVKIPHENLILGESGYIVREDRAMLIFSLYMKAKLDKKLSFSMDSKNEQKFTETAKNLYDKFGKSF